MIIRNFLLIIAALTASAVVTAGDIDAGKKKSVTCLACHGADGNSIIPNFPKLAGQGEAYLIKQLKDFKSGKRKDAAMLPIVSALTDKDIADLAAYYNSQTASKGKSDKNLFERGEKIYRGGDVKSGISACSACHGPNGKGLDLAKYPAIGGQHAAYTEIQLKKFSNTGRTNDEVGMMQDIAKKLSDDDIKAVSSFIEGLN